MRQGNHTKSDLKMNVMLRNDYWMRVERLRRSLDIKYERLVYDALDGEIRKFVKDLLVYGVEGANNRLSTYLWNEEI